MDKLIEIAKSLKSEITNLPEYKEYIANKEMYEKSVELQQKRIQIAANSSNKETHERLLKEYNSHPLVVNYNSSKEELLSIISPIVNILN